MNNQVMPYPPGQGKSGPYLMALWRHYLERCAESQGKPDDLLIAGCTHTAVVFGFLDRLLLPGRPKPPPGALPPIPRHEQDLHQPGEVENLLARASIDIYTHLNALGWRFAAGNAEASRLLREIEERVQDLLQTGAGINRSAAALRAVFPVLSLMTLIIDQGRGADGVIRKVEERFSAGDEMARTPWEQLANALYRIVEMMQVFVTLSDAELQDQVRQITEKFQEEDQVRDLKGKVGNGFCRLFELSHLLANHLDAVLPGEIRD